MAKKNQNENRDQKSAEEFVEEIRTSKSFLEEGKQDFIESIYLPDNLLVHRFVWKTFYTTECDFRRRISLAFEKYLKNLPEKQEEAFWEAFCDIICWMEMYRDKYEGPKDITMQNLCEIYAWFMEYLLRNDKFKPLHLSEKGKESFFKKMREIAPDCEEWYEANRLFPLILKYISFHRDCVNLYCYDKTIEPQLIHDRLFLIQSPYDFYRWKLIDARYFLNEERYDSITENIMSDLQIDHFEWKGKPISTQHFLVPLEDISYKKYIYYEQGLNEQKGASWFDKLEQLYAKEEKEVLPFTWLTVQEYLSMYKDDALENFDEEFLDLLAFKFNKRKFQWGQKCFDVFRKPFIRIDNDLICPTMFLGRNEWFYTFINTALENLALPQNIKFQKEVSDSMEIFVAELFKKCNSKWKISTNLKGENEKGDIDVWVENDHDILLIQLKRTKLRTALADAYYEYKHTDLDASKQISECEIDNPDNKRVTRWIVSTSYERCMERINGILKINYFDLIYHLRTLKYNNLREFIEFIENDSALRYIYKIMQEISYNRTAASEDLDLARNILCLPLKRVEPSVYNIPLQNDNYSDDNQFDKALELEKNGKRRTAIKILETLTCSYPDFYKYWLALANMYAEEKQYAKAFDCYEKALRIVPDDPWIIRNYATTCNEAKKFEKYSELLQILKTKYWFVDFR